MLSSYVTDPDHETHIPLALDNPRVIVARTSLGTMEEMQKAVAVFGEVLGKKKPSTA